MKLTRYNSAWRHDNSDEPPYFIGWDSLEVKMAVVDFDLPREISRLADAGFPSKDAAKKALDSAIQKLKQIKPKLDKEKYDLRAFDDFLSHAQRSKIISGSEF